MAEFELIERIRERSGAGQGVTLGIGDDAAVLIPTPGRELVATTDALVLDRHFTADWPGQDVGTLAAQANLSDLAAMGAIPRWALLALTLPDLDEAWIDAFLDGFLGALEAAGAALVGGNLARGPLNIGVQLLGEVPAGQAVTRSGARAGDRLIVTGTVGDAAAALCLGEAAGAALTARLRRPTARLRAGRALRGHARAMIDLSDGLLADLGHLLAGGLGAEIDLDALPASQALAAAVPDRSRRRALQTGGGSDYELLACLPADSDLLALAESATTPLTEIGRVTDSGGVEAFSEGRRVIDGLGAGWDHFRDD
jgi:thiamine-monophosphate kinase